MTPLPCDLPGKQSKKGVKSPSVDLFTSILMSARAVTPPHCEKEENASWKIKLLSELGTDLLGILLK